MKLNLKRLNKILSDNKAMHKIMHLLHLNYKMLNQKIKNKILKRLKKRKEDRNYKHLLVVQEIDTFRLKQFY